MIVRRFLHNELQLFYASTSIRSFALSLISVFVPIFLLDVGFSLSDIFIFMIVINITHILVSPLSGYLISKFGPKHMMFISTFIYIVFYMLLYDIALMPQHLMTLAVVFGIARILYFHAYNVDFALASRKGSRGKQIGNVTILQNIAAASGPLMGGLLLTLMDFNRVFMLTASLLIVSTLPLFATKDFYKKMSFSLKNYLSLPMLRDALVYIGFGIETNIGFIVWPLYVYLAIAQDLSSIGGMMSAMMFIGFITTYFISKYADKHNKFITSLGSIANMWMWLLAPLVQTIGIVFGFNAIYGATATLYYIPHSGKVFEKADRPDMIEYLTFREVFIQIGALMLYGLLLVSLSFKLSFFAGAAASLLMILF